MDDNLCPAPPFLLYNCIYRIYTLNSLCQVNASFFLVICLQSGATAVIPTCEWNDGGQNLKKYSKRISFLVSLSRLPGRRHPIEVGAKGESGDSRERAVFLYFYQYFQMFIEIGSKRRGGGQRIVGLHQPRFVAAGIQGVGRQKDSWVGRTSRNDFEYVI